MNYKLILQILLVIAIISTICICITKPAMHKSVLVYDSGYTITPEEKVTYEEEIIPIMTQPPQTEEVKMTVTEKIDSQIAQQKADTIQYVQAKTPKTVKTTTVQNQTNTPKTVTQTKVAQNTTAKNNVQQQTTTTPNTHTVKVTTTSPASTPIQTVTTTTQQAPTTQTQQHVSAPIGNSTTTVVNKPATQTVTTPTPQVKVLTAQEEEIAWNKWRSNLQNQIMKDSRLPIVPNGTVFKFSFTVDKYGKVTNVKTWSTNSAYTPYAIQYIAPAIRSYQGRSILNFPAGSNRVITDVTGGWKISSTSKYSTPQDYNDIEKVTR